jgi:hypothetical protein
MTRPQLTGFQSFSERPQMSLHWPAVSPTSRAGHAEIKTFVKVMSLSREGGARYTGGFKNAVSGGCDVLPRVRCDGYAEDTDHGFVSDRTDQRNGETDKATRIDDALWNQFRR